MPSICLWLFKKTKKTPLFFLFTSEQKKIYKDQMESMLQVHVFPLFRNELGYMRARVCDC